VSEPGIIAEIYIIAGAHVLSLMVECGCVVAAPLWLCEVAK
jgi:hypothetical protein